MHHNHIVRVLSQPFPHLEGEMNRSRSSGRRRRRRRRRTPIQAGATHCISKLEHLLQCGDVVVVNEHPLDPLVEEGGVVGLLAAQVEHLVPVLVLGLQEGSNLLDGVPGELAV